MISSSVPVSKIFYLVATCNRGLELHFGVQCASTVRKLPLRPFSSVFSAPLRLGVVLVGLFEVRVCSGDALARISRKGPRRV